MSIRKSFALLLALLLALSAASAFAEDKSYTLDLATAYAADGPAGLALRKFVDDVNAKSGGSITLNLFTDGTLGTPNENYLSLSVSELDLACAGLEGLDLYAPKYTFLSSPFLIKSFDHLAKILDGEVGAGLKECYAENNIQVLAWHKRDVRNFSSNKPVAVPADVAGLKLRLPGMTTYVEAWGYLNAISTTVSMSELYTALQTGVAEASEGGYEQMTTLKLYEVQDYTSETQHVFEFVGLFIAKDLYDGMSDAQKAVLNECAAEAMAYADQLSEEKRADYKKQCVDGGMEYVEVDREAFVSALSDFHKGQFETKWAPTTYDEVMSYAD